MYTMFICAVCLSANSANSAICLGANRPLLHRCGMRAGYMELVNFDDAVLPFVEILLTGDISPPVTGQIGLDVMADPPRPGEPSHSRYMQVHT